MKFANSSLLVLLFSLAQNALSVPTEAASLSTDSTPASIEAIVESDTKVVAAAKKTDSFARCQAAVGFPLPRKKHSLNKFPVPVLKCPFAREGVLSSK